MARKNTETSTTKGSKKTATLPPPAAEQAAETPQKVAQFDAKPANLPPAMPVGNVNVEEKIRLRAYELYLQRRATSGGSHGNESQDWLVAEREILSRGDGGNHHSA